LLMIFLQVSAQLGPEISPSCRTTHQQATSQSRTS